ncbi:MAG: phosphatidylglycerophosphatase A [Candidatus Aminicenantes bacterium]|nr:phosphatidylglycerophosphatase A [Candidatus Aminicenantes bacterium]
MIKLAKIISTFFGVGLFPLAPGTVASLVVVFLYRFLFYQISWPIYLLLFLIIFFLGTYTSSVYARALNLKDPGKIVIDEVAGQWLALFFLNPDWKWLGACFILFRFFDIIKPLGIKKLENLPYGWGIMADDVGTGVAVNLLLQIARVFLR